MKNAVAGCSHWNPTQPFEEIDITDLKNEINQFKDSDHLSDDMVILLEKTFSYQRNFINNIENTPSVEHIKQEWPILFNKHALLWHFQKVCHPEVKHFVSYLNQKLEKILCFDKTGVSEKFVDKRVQVLHVLSDYFKEDLSKIYKITEVGTKTIMAISLKY